MATEKPGTRGICSSAGRTLARAAGVWAARLGTRVRRKAEPWLRPAQAERPDGCHHTDLAGQHRLQLDLLTSALSDPDLDAVLNSIDAPPTVRRRHVFADAIYTTAVHAYRAGNVSLEGLHRHLRMTCQSSVFRDYWAATRHRRTSLDASSDEAEVCRMVDDLIHDLEESETDEWWVVGEPPAD